MQIMRQRREIPIHIYRYCATLANFALACIMIHSITQTVQILQTSHCTLSNGAIKYSNMQIQICKFHKCKTKCTPHHHENQHSTFSSQDDFSAYTCSMCFPPSPPPPCTVSIPTSPNSVYCLYLFQFRRIFITERFNADL